MSPRRRKKQGLRKGRVLLLLVTIAVVAGSAVYLYFFVRDQLNVGEGVSDYRSRITKTWTSLSEEGSLLEDYLQVSESPENLQKVATSAKRMKSIADTASQSWAGEEPSADMKSVYEKEGAALKSLISYLDTLCSVNDVSETGWEALKSELRSRGKTAEEKVKDFLEEADFLKTSVTTTIFRSSDFLTVVQAETPTTPEEEGKETKPEDESSSDRGEITSTVHSFMDADMREFQPDIMWPLISTNRKEEEAQERGLTEEYFYSAWPEAWGGQEPYDYEVDTSSIQVTGNNASVVVTVRLRTSQEPLQELVGLVRESGGWKIDTYPFVGWR